MNVSHFYFYFLHIHVLGRVGFTSPEHVMLPVRTSGGNTTKQSKKKQKTKNRKKPELVPALGDTAKLASSKTIFNDQSRQQGWQRSAPTIGDSPPSPVKGCTPHFSAQQREQDEPSSSSLCTMLLCPDKGVCVTGGRRPEPGAGGPG